MTNHLKTRLYLGEIIIIKTNIYIIGFPQILLVMQPQRVATENFPAMRCQKLGRICGEASAELFNLPILHPSTQHQATTSVNHFSCSKEQHLKTFRKNISFTFAG